MSTRLCTTLGLVHLTQRRRNLLDTTIRTAPPICPLVVTVTGKVNHGSTLANRSIGIWKEPRRNLWNEALPRTTFSCHVGIPPGQGKTRGTSQQGCSGPPGRQPCRNCVTKTNFATNTGARTLSPPAWDTTDLTGPNRVPNEGAVTNTLRSGSRGRRRPTRFPADDPSLLRYLRNDRRGRFRRVIAAQSRRRGREREKRKTRT